MIDPVLTLPVSLCFAFFWAITSFHKFAHLTWFQSVLADYNLFPNWMLKPLSICVALAEVMIALALLFMPIWGAFASISLLFAYALLLGFNALRGQSLKDCGCSWGRHTLPDEPYMSVKPIIFRNIGLIALSALILIPQSQRVLSLTDWSNALLASLCVLGLGVTLTHLSSNYSRMKAFGHV